jgi:very-short-patch-repair endonuclease/endogenous inhibitor of DNA gyrase (YacG/DUF329 family)
MIKKGVTKNCETCGIEFYKPQSQKHIRFCSISCKGIASRKIGGRGFDKTCKYCGIQYKGEEKNKGSFCSRLCFSASRKNTVKCVCKVCEIVYSKIPSQVCKNNFCSVKCRQVFEKRHKVKKVCKTCNIEFLLSKSTVLQRKHKIKYCSIKCRNKDPEWVYNACIMGNLIQQHNKEPNKLELKGRKILQDIGIKDFQEQVLMFKKFCVDVLIESKKLIIQWDGTYWHTKEKRRKQDMSQDSYLKKCGYRVLRVTDMQIENSVDEVYKNIRSALA